MKTFLLINGTQATIKKFPDSSEAQTYCENYFDHSKTASFFEVESLSILNTNVKILM